MTSPALPADQGAGDGAAAAAQLRDHGAVAAADRHVVEAAAACAVPLLGDGGELVAGPDRRHERDVAPGGDRALPVAVAGDGERRVGEQEDEAAVRECRGR
jgi:hypothetical protein